MPATTNLTRIKGLKDTELFFKSCILSSPHTNMRQALLSFVVVVAALCVQQAVSHPLDKRDIIDGVYNMLI